MRKKEYKSVYKSVYPCVYRNTLLFLMIGCLHGACAREVYDHDPVVIIDENDVRRLGLAGKPRDNIVDNGPIKPVVIIDENEVRRFNMPQRSNNVNERVSSSDKALLKEAMKPGVKTVAVKHDAMQKNLTKKSAHHCSTIFIHGRCPTDNANDTNEMEKTFWVPESDIKYFGENSLDTSTLLNISEKFDSSNERTNGRRNARKPISKPSIKMRKKAPHHNFANLHPVEKTPAPSSIRSPVIGDDRKLNSHNSSISNDYKIGLYKISKITNNGNDSKNGRPLAVNISVSHLPPTANMKSLRKKFLTLKTNVTVVKKIVSALVNKTIKGKGKVDMNDIKKNGSSVAANKDSASNSKNSHPKLKMVPKKPKTAHILTNKTVGFTNKTGVANSLANSPNKRNITTNKTADRQPTQKHDSPAFYNVSSVSEEQRNATLHAFYDTGKHKKPTHTKETVTRTSVFKPLLPVVFTTVPNLVDTVLFSVNDTKEPSHLSDYRNNIVHPEPLNETSGAKKTEVPDLKAASNNSTADGSSNITQTVRLVIPPSMPSDSVLINSPIIGKTFQLQETAGVSNKNSEEAPKKLFPTQHHRDVNSHSIIEAKRR